MNNPNMPVCYHRTYSIDNLVFYRFGIFIVFHRWEIRSKIWINPSIGRIHCSTRIFQFNNPLRRCLLLLLIGGELIYITNRIIIVIVLHQSKYNNDINILENVFFNSRYAADEWLYTIVHLTVVDICWIFSSLHPPLSLSHAHSLLIWLYSSIQYSLYRFCLWFSINKLPVHTKILSIFNGHT